MSSALESLMPRKRRSWRRALLPAVLVAGAIAINSQAALLVIGGDMPTEPMPLDLESKRYLAFNESIYAFYGDQQFSAMTRSEEHTSELQSRPHLVCRLLLEKKN